MTTLDLNQQLLGRLTDSSDSRTRWTVLSCFIGFFQKSSMGGCCPRSLAGRGGSSNAASGLDTGPWKLPEPIQPVKYVVET